MNYNILFIGNIHITYITYIITIYNFPLEDYKHIHTLFKHT